MVKDRITWCKLVESLRFIGHQRQKMIKRGRGVEDEKEFFGRFVVGLYLLLHIHQFLCTFTFLFTECVPTIPSTSVHLHPHTHCSRTFAVWDEADSLGNDWWIHISYISQVDISVAFEFLQI